MKSKNIAIIGSQMDLGAFRKGVDMGPLAIRHAGLSEKIRDIGYDVKDYGDIVPPFALEEGNPRICLIAKAPSHATDVKLMKT